jgi:CheY-like chemotaxis protein
VPVVIVSVLADEHKGVALGAAKVLQKPLTRAALLDAVAATTAGTPGRKVLVIDDDPLAVELVASNLAERCEVARAHDGAQALATAVAAPPDLIILDLMMPGMSGFEVVDAVRREPAIAGVPIIVMTGKSVTAEDRARLNGRVQQVVSKSRFDRTGFLSEVERALLERAH